MHGGGELRGIANDPYALAGHIRPQRPTMRVSMTLFGILNVYKPADVTSREVVNRVERLVRPAKAGHAGTLDPLAEGVLVICVGQATRLIQYVQQMRKHYRATFLLGCTSESDDTEREVIALPNTVIPTPDEIEQATRHFIGDIQQRPPAHSAIKIGGKRAYKLARKGAQFELAERTVTIHEITVLRYEYPELDLDIECGSGTYIRSLARDLGAALGTAAVMSALERTAIGCFQASQAISTDSLSAESLLQNIQPALTAIPSLPTVRLSDDEIVEIRHGRPIALPPHDMNSTSSVDPNAEWAAVDGSGQLVALLFQKRPGQLWPQCNFDHAPSASGKVDLD